MNKNIGSKIIIILFILLMYMWISNACHAINITSDEYCIKKINNENYIVGIYQSTRVEKIKQALKSKGKINVYNKEEKEVANTEIIKTGYEIGIDNEKYKVIVCGDINGDGKNSITDLLKIKRYLVGKEEKSENIISTDIDASGDTNITDIIKMKRLLTRKIEAKDVFEEKRSNTKFEYKINNLTNKIIITKLANEKITGTLEIPGKIENGIVKEIRSLGKNNNITKIIIPNEVEKINENAFKEMNCLKEIVVDKTNSRYTTKDGILYNKDKNEIIAYPSTLVKNKIYFFRQHHSGTAILLQSNDKFAMIDTGWEKDVNDAIKYMKSIGVKKLEFILITHWHNDHYLGLAEIINSFEVEKLYIKAQKTISNKYAQNIYDVDIALANKKGIDIIYLDKLPDTTYSLKMEQMQLKLYNLKTYAKERNTESIISYIKIGNTKTLLPGDADTLLDDLMKEIAKEIGYNVDVYKAPHHSCNNSAKVYSLNPRNIVITNSAKAENFKEEMIAIYPNAKRYFSNDVKNVVVVNYTLNDVKIETL